MRKVLPTVLLVCGLGFNAFASNLKEIVTNVLDTNPIVNERLHNYRATVMDIRKAKAGYLPTLDVEAGVGVDNRGSFSSESNKKYDIFESAIILRQNIFKGFSTQETVNYQAMRALASAYSYLEKANDVTLQTIKSYIDILRYQAMLKNAQLHVNHIEKLYEKVTKSYKAGLTKMSEVSRVQASLSSARSNMLVARNRLTNSIYNFKRVTGRMVSPNELEPISFNLPLPDSQEKATQIALKYNPSIKVGEYNTKEAEFRYKESKSKFYPTVDAEVMGGYNDRMHSDSNNPYPDRKDDVKAMLKIKYNIFRGGADEAARVGMMSRVSKEAEVLNDLKRQVTEGLDLSWSTYQLNRERIPVLQRYLNESKKTLKLYWKEYNLGERSLLDLLAIENDLKRANDELVDAKYNMLLAKYRIVDAMGLTVASIVNNVESIYQRVGLRGGSEGYWWVFIFQAIIQK